MPTPTPLDISVIGAGPCGLALALHAAARLPRARVTVFDARAPERDVAADGRTLALALGSVQWLAALAPGGSAWPQAEAEPIVEVEVSQAAPALADGVVRLRAADEGQPQLGAVLSYGALVAALQRAWRAVVDAAPGRHALRLGTPVAALKVLHGGVEVDAGTAERFDLVVVAEGGVFADQARKALAHDYGQTAWVGQATLDGGTRGLAIERFTRQGPLALLPLPPAADGTLRAALVWCVDRADDPVPALDDAQRLAVLNTLLPPSAGRLRSLTPLKAFALGLNAERSLVDGRTVRIGNAAQTLHPVAGQGLNLGLRDAHQLVEALRFEVDVDRALRRLEAARAPDRWTMIGATDLLARGFTWKSPLVAGARGLALAALERATPLKSLLARQMMFGWR